MEDGESNALTALGNVILTQHEGTILGNKIGKHASKDAAVVAIQLTGRVARAWYQSPLARQRALFLVLVFVLQVLQQVAQVRHAATTHAVVVLNSLLLHKSDGGRPVLVALINGENNLVEVENVLACANESNEQIERKSDDRGSVLDHERVE